jgi:hypothetical protein
MGRNTKEYFSGVVESQTFLIVNLMRPDGGKTQEAVTGKNRAVRARPHVRPKAREGWICDPD